MGILAGFIFLWQLLIVIFHVPAYIVPQPSRVFAAMHDQLELLLHHTSVTSLEMMLGLIIGILFGMVSALSMAFFSTVRLWMLPIVVMSQAIPTFAIAPLLVLWFGFGLATKIITIVLMLFFPVTSSFYDGLTQTPSYWLDTAKTMDGLPWRTLIFIQVPAALPHLATGVRLAASIAPIGAIIAEWVGASQGLGYLMVTAGARLDMPLMFACLLLIMATALGLYKAVDIVLKRLLFW